MHNEHVKFKQSILVMNTCVYVGVGMHVHVHVYVCVHMVFYKYVQNHTCPTGHNQFRIKVHLYF
jgi:hypothetical protein